MTENVILLIIFGIITLVSLTGLLVSLFRGEMKKFIEEKMEEAETHDDWTSDKKFQYVLECFQKKYKIFQFILNCKKFIEAVIDLSKKINYKK